MGSTACRPSLARRLYFSCSLILRRNYRPLEVLVTFLLSLQCRRISAESKKYECLAPSYCLHPSPTRELKWGLTFLRRWYDKIRSHYRLRPSSICHTNGVTRIIKIITAWMPCLFEKPDRPLSCCCLFSQ